MDFVLEMNEEGETEVIFENGEHAILTTNR